MRGKLANKLIDMAWTFFESFFFLMNFLFINFFIKIFLFIFEILLLFIYIYFIEFITRNKLSREPF